MRAAVAQQKRQGALARNRVCDMSIPAALRVGEARPSAPTTSLAARLRPSAVAQPRAVGREVEVDDLARPPRRLGQRFGENRGEDRVLDIQAEGVAADLRSAERHGPRGEQRACRVDDAQGSHRRPGRLDAPRERRALSRKSSEPPNRATVRPGGAAARRRRRRSRKTRRAAKPSAAARPARPAPTTTTSTVSAGEEEAAAIATLSHACF